MSRDSEKSDNVYPMNDTGSIDSLVKHMRLVRDSIPVNKKLRRELRARLIEGRKAAAENVVSGFPARSASRGIRGAWRWAAGLILALSLLAAFFTVFRDAGEKTLATGPVSEMARFWAEESPLAPTVSPSGDLIVAERGGALMLLSRQGSRFATVMPPKGEKYSSPSLSPDGRKLALARGREEGADLVVLENPAGLKPGDLPAAFEAEIGKAVVLARHPAGSAISGLVWSPEGSAVAYSLLENGQPRLFVAQGGKSPVSLGPGARPSWSPDGSRLLIEREEGGNKTLWLVDRDGSAEHSLGEGRYPVWNKSGYLIFVKTGIQEKILSYLPDGSPQFTVQRKTGEIRWIFLGKGSGVEKRLPLAGGIQAGSRLLMDPAGQTGPEELQWVKSMELGGVREPRTLYLDRTGDIEGLAPGDGMSLFLSRRDGGTVILARISLTENVVEREDTIR